MNEPRYYIRNKNGQVCGVFVATSNEVNATIGYSLCNASDAYNRTKALEIAFNRANAVLSGRKDGYNVPYSLKASYKRFYERCERYYNADGKGDKGPRKVVIDCDAVANTNALLAAID
jgi:hypothetical protein